MKKPQAEYECSVFEEKKKKPEQPGQVKKGRGAGGEGGRELVVQDLLGRLRGWELSSG